MAAPVVVGGQAPGTHTGAHKMSAGVGCLPWPGHPRPRTDVSSTSFEDRPAPSPRHPPPGSAPTTLCAGAGSSRVPRGLQGWQERGTSAHTLCTGTGPGDASHQMSGCSLDRWRTGPLTARKGCVLCCPRVTGEATGPAGGHRAGSKGRREKAWTCFYHPQRRCAIHSGRCMGVRPAALGSLVPPSPEAHKCDNFLQRRSPWAPGLRLLPTVGPHGQLFPSGPPPPRLCPPRSVPSDPIHSCLGAGGEQSQAVEQQWARAAPARRCLASSGETGLKTREGGTVPPAPCPSCFPGTSARALTLGCRQPSGRK